MRTDPGQKEVQVNTGVVCCKSQPPPTQGATCPPLPSLSTRSPRLQLPAEPRPTRGEAQRQWSARRSTAGGSGGSPGTTPARRLTSADLTDSPLDPRQVAQPGSSSTKWGSCLLYRTRCSSSHKRPGPARQRSLTTVTVVISNDRGAHVGRTESTGSGHFHVTQREAEGIVVSPPEDYFKIIFSRFCTVKETIHHRNRLHGRST